MKKMLIKLLILFQRLVWLSCSDKTINIYITKVLIIAYVSLAELFLTIHFFNSRRNPTIILFRFSKNNTAG